MNGFGRTTGIEPARGGFTIHCLDPLGYIRPLIKLIFLSRLKYISILDKLKEIETFIFYFKSKY